MWPFAFYMFPTYRPKRKTHIGERWRLDWGGRLPGWLLHFQHLSGQMLVLEGSAWSLGLWLTLCCSVYGSRAGGAGWTPGDPSSRTVPVQGRVTCEAELSCVWGQNSVEQTWDSTGTLLWIPHLTQACMCWILNECFVGKRTDTEVNYGRRRWNDKTAKVTSTVNIVNETIQTNVSKSRMRKLMK